MKIDLNEDEIQELIEFVRDYSYQLTTGNLYSDLDAADKMTMREKKKLLLRSARKLKTSFHI